MSVLFWRREMAATLSLTPTGVRILIASLGFACAALGSSLAWVTTRPLAGLDLPAEIQQSITRSSASAVCLTTGLLVVIVCLVAPRTGALKAMIDITPVPRSIGALGFYLPMMVLMVSASLLLTMWSLFLTWKLSASPLQTVVYFAGAVLTVAGLTLALVAVFDALRALAQVWLRLPEHLARTVAGGLVMSSVIAVFAGELVFDALRFTDAPHASSWILPSAILARLGTPGADPAFLTAHLVLSGAWVAIGLGLFVARFSRPDTSRDAGPANAKLLPNVTLPAKRFSALVWTEFLVLARAPQTAVVLLVAVPGLAGTRLALGRGLPASLALAVSGAIAVAGMFVAGQSVGRTLSHHWVGRGVLGTVDFWVVPKVVATFMLFWAIFAVVVAAALMIGTAAGNDLLLLVTGGLIAWPAALVSGALLPYSERSSLSPGLTALGTVLIYAPLSLLIDRVFADQGALLGTMSAVGASMVLLAIYLALARRLSTIADTHV